MRTNGAGTGQRELAVLSEADEKRRKEVFDKRQAELKAIYLKQQGHLAHEPTAISPSAPAVTANGATNGPLHGAVSGLPQRPAALDVRLGREDCEEG